VTVSEIEAKEIAISALVERASIASGTAQIATAFHPA
jgi:hypothetical protein